MSMYGPPNDPGQQPYQDPYGPPQPPPYVDPYVDPYAPPPPIPMSGPPVTGPPWGQPQQPWGPPAAPPRKSNTGLIFGLVAGGLALLLCVGAGVVLLVVRSTHRSSPSVSAYSPDPVPAYSPPDYSPAPGYSPPAPSPSPKPTEASQVDKLRAVKPGQCVRNDSGDHTKVTDIKIVTCAKGLEQVISNTPGRAEHAVCDELHGSNYSWAYWLTNPPPFTLCVREYV